MNITHLKINPVQVAGRMRAIVSITFDNALTIHDIKIIEGPDRLFLAMPSRKMADGTFKDIVHPINPEMRNLMEEAILQKYSEDIMVSAD